MYTESQERYINQKIDRYNRAIEMNESEQYAYMMTYGEMNQELYDKHEKLVSELEGVLILRRILQ